MLDTGKFNKKNCKCKKDGNLFESGKSTTPSPSGKTACALVQLATTVPWEKPSYICKLTNLSDAVKLVRPLLTVSVCWLGRRC